MMTSHQGRRSAKLINFKKQKLSERLRTLMVEQGLSINELARRIQSELPGEKFNAVNLFHYRAGRSVPRPRYLIALSKAVGVALEDLLPSDETIEATQSEPDGLLAEPVPAFYIEDLSDGQAWLQINQRLPWPSVIKILQALKGGSADP